MQKIEHFTPPTSPQQNPPLMSSTKYVISKNLLGLAGSNCPIDNFTNKLTSTCACIPSSTYSKSWSYNSNYGDMYMCQ